MVTPGNLGAIDAELKGPAPEQLLRGMESTDGKKQIKNPTPEQLEHAFKTLENEITNLIKKLSEIDAEKKEHDLVMAALEKLPETRRCCRMVGGVIAERTVGQTLPAIRDNRDRIMTVVDKMNEQLKSKIDTRKKFQEQFGLDTSKKEGVQPGVKTADTVRGMSDMVKPGGQSAGVLV